MNHWVLETPFDHNLAKQTAEAIFGKLPLFYGLGSYPGVAAHRWKAQMNENAKIMAFANVFPELNHNEIMGWLNADKQGVHQWLTVILEGEAVSSRMHAGAQITADLIHEKTQILRIRAKGNSVLENMLYLITLGDFVSVYLAFLYKTDPTHVSLIRQLKERMSKAS
jgi:glucose/mannose-6-phosphate isomerase